MIRFTKVALAPLVAVTTWLSGAPSAQAAPRAACSSLANYRVAASSIGLPTAGARVVSAQDRPPTGDLPATCQVKGEVTAATPGPAIKFQVNLPVQWNGKAIQLGGGGFDGTLVTGLDNLPGTGSPDYPSAPKRPLARGYVTFGSDGGHEGSALDGTFAKNDVARSNYLGEAVKRVHDAALVLVRRYYGSAPTKTYFAGGSKGGQEALVAAQRYGGDYDGVIAYFPAKDMSALTLGWANMLHAAYGAGGASLSPVKQQLITRRSMEACDGLDGLKDGVIANVAACRATFSTANLRCSRDDSSASDCLSAAEVATVNSAQQESSTPFPLKNGLSLLPAYPILEGGKLDKIWMSDTGAGGTAIGAFVDGVLNNFLRGAGPIDPANFDPLRYRDAFLSYSSMGDANSTDLAAFTRHGGKMILVQGTADMLVPAQATTAYFLRLQAQYPQTASTFARYYLQPGYGHANGDFNMSFDSLSALESWVEREQAPHDLVSVDANPDGRGRAMPLCDYPSFPRYVGGNPSQAASFRCAFF